MCEEQEEQEDPYQCQPPVCVDNFGNNIYKCFWTNKLVAITDAVITGSFYPGIKVKRIAVRDHQAAKKSSHGLFNIMDANCNTCVNLCRINHEKNAGFLYGRCSINSQEPKSYPVKDGIMQFHPADYMGMGCYVPR